MSKKVLYKDVNKLKQIEASQESIQKDFKAVLKLFKDTTGTSNVLIADILENGAQSFLERFTKRYSHLYPEVTDMKRNFEENSQMRLSDIDAQIKALANKISSINLEYAVENNEITFSKPDVNVYLNPALTYQYKLALDLLSIFKRVKAEGGYTPTNAFLRASPNGFFLIQGTELAINNNFFKK